MSELLSFPNAAPFQFLSACWSEDFKSWFARVVSEAPSDSRHVVFDLDHTILDGDIGEETFNLLAQTGLVRWRESLEIAPKVVLEQLEPGTLRQADLLNLYHRAVARAQELPEKVGDLVLAQIYRWIVQVMVGLRVSEVQQCATKALSSCQLNFAILELISELLERDFSVWVVSASNHWSVRVAVEKLINPFLARRGHKQIKLSQVFGISSYLLDARFFMVNTAGPSSQAFESGTRQSEFSGYRLSACLVEPVPTFIGKAELVAELIDQRPHLVVGDSRGDLAMAELARFKLFSTPADQVSMRSSLARRSWGDSLFVLNPREEIPSKIAVAAGS